MSGSRYNANPSSNSFATSDISSPTGEEHVPSGSTIPDQTTSPSIPNPPTVNALLSIPYQLTAVAIQAIGTMKHQMRGLDPSLVDNALFACYPGLFAPNSSPTQDFDDLVQDYNDLVATSPATTQIPMGSVADMPSGFLSSEHSNGESTMP
jgi:hypothetical protein